MKFIDINSVRGLEIDQPVFTKDEDGNFGYGKLIEVKKNANGITRMFEMAFFGKDGKRPELDQMISTNITHVCIPK